MAQRRSSPKVAAITSQFERGSGTRRTGEVSEERPSVAEARRALLGDDPSEKAQASWDIKRMAEAGQDISVLIGAISRAMRDDNPQVRINLSAAAMYAAMKRADVSLVLTRDLIEDPHMPVRNSMLFALGHMAQNGHDISLFVDAVFERMSRDIAPANQQAAQWALRCFAASGKQQAAQVLMLIKDEGADEGLKPELIQMRRELRAVCASSMLSE